MSSERPLLALALCALSAACVERQGPKPPSFPGGGLLAQSTPLPQPQLLSALEGVYDTSSRFGSSVVVHASAQGDPAAGLEAALAILARDRFAFAILRPGCLTDATTAPAVTRLVLEGYWRYLDAPMPDAGSTGLVRVFVEPAPAAEALCAGQPPAAGDLPARLVGATGEGDALPETQLEVTFVQPRRSRLVDGQKSFLVGAHHGGCQTGDNCGVSENTPETFILASQLGADYLEVDVHLTADGVPVCFHLPSLLSTLVQGTFCAGKLAAYTYDQLLANCRLKNGEVIPRLEDVLRSGLGRTDLLVWLDMKTPAAVAPVAQLLGSLGAEQPALDVMGRVTMGLPSQDVIDAYLSAQQAGQLAPGQRCLIEQEASDVARIPCVAWSPRYTRGPLTSTVRELQQQGKFVGYWTINDPTVMDAFLAPGAPNGILTNYLGLLNQRWEAIGVLPPYPLGSP